MLVMFERVAQAVEVSGAGFGSGWAFAFIAALVVAGYAIAAIRGYIDGSGRSVLQAAVVFLLALAGWWALDDLNRRDFAAERGALEARAFELTTRALIGRANYAAALVGGAAVGRPGPMDAAACRSRRAHHSSSAS